MDPPSSGNFSIVARAINTEQGTAVSQAVVVFVTQSEEAGQLNPEEGKVYPAVFPPAPSGGSGPVALPDGEIPDPAAPWQGTPADWLTDLSSGSAPAAPELAVAADGCNVKMDIHDLSGNEEGFTLYRQTTASPEWVHVADLSSHAGQGWIETQDSDLSGGITYYVEAFNSNGQTSSNLALVNLDPQVCPAHGFAADLPVLNLEVKNLVLDGSAGSIYCYARLGGGQWSRWPEMGFLPTSGQELPLLVKPQLLANLNDSGSAPGPQTLDLKLECWGWQGGKPVLLGTLADRFDLVAAKAVHVVFSGLVLDISPNIITGVKMETFTLEALIQPWIMVKYDPYSIDNLGFVPESDQMPLLLAWVTYDRGVCETFTLEPSYKEMNCFPMPGFNSGPGGINPQPYLVWYVFNHSCEGYPEKDCFATEWWQGFADRYPDPYTPGVHFFVISQFFSADGDPSGSIGEQVGLVQQAWRILPNEPAPNAELCRDGYRSFRVAMEAGTSLGQFITYSDWVEAPCPEALGDTVQIEVTFDTLDLENTDDEGAGNTHADNVYGGFQPG